MEGGLFFQSAAGLRLETFQNQGSSKLIRIECVSKEFSKAYESGSPELRNLRTLEDFTKDMEEARFTDMQRSKVTSVVIM